MLHLLPRILLVCNFCLCTRVIQVHNVTRTMNQTCICALKKYIQLYCPFGISSVGIQVAFPWESQLQRSRDTELAIHNPPNSDMDHRIFNLHTAINACVCTRGLYGHRKRVCTENLLWEKILAAPGNRTCVNSVTVRRSSK